MTATAIPVATPVPLDLGLYAELRRFGATDVSACFSCGTCTATCPLVEEDATFPRRIIRYAQVGMKEALLSSKELWTCYHCGECSESCPTGADPGEFMAAARRYAIASYEPTGIASRLATSAPFAAGFIALVAVVMAAFMLSGPGAADGSGFFAFVSAPLIHNLGIGVLVLWAFVMVVGLVRMGRALLGRVDGRPAARAVGRAAWTALVDESLGQRRYQRDCADDASANEASAGARTVDTLDRPTPLYLQRWFVHWATMLGFLGLLVATGLDFLLEIVGLKPTGAPVPLWYPVRLLGTVAGLALMYGTTVLAVWRVRGTKRSFERSTVSDWSFLGLLWLVGATGFVIELSLYLPVESGWANPLFLVHVALAMTLVLLMPFGKFAHALYRPVALFALELRREATPKGG